MSRILVLQIHGPILSVRIGVLGGSIVLPPKGTAGESDRSHSVRIPDLAPQWFVCTA